METTKVKKPLGFYICSLGFTFERLAFYTAKYLLPIWIATAAASGGLGLTSAEGAVLSGAFVAYTYITPVFGGYIADYWLNPRICVFIGMVLMGAGYLVAWQATGLTHVWIMVALVSLGTGLFKGNLSGVNGLQFRKEDMDNAFSIQYSFVNLGSFIGTTLLVPIALAVGFQTGFMICGLFLLFDAVWFLIGSKSLGELGKKPFKSDQRQFAEKKNKEKEKAEPLTAADKKRVLAIVLVTVFSIVFWAVWYMTYMPIYFHFGYGEGADFLNKANWVVGGWEVPTSYFDSLNAIACISLGPILAKVWSKLEKRPQGDLSMFKKTALGIILLALTFVVLVVADMIAGESGQVSLLWIALAGILMSLGEMVFSPLGNSFIVKLSPAKLIGLLLGLWPIAVFFANQIWPPIYNFLGTVDFTIGYSAVAGVVALCGVVLWLMSGTLDKLEKGE